MKKLPAAAIPVGAKVRVSYEKGEIDIIISEVANAEPRAGLITWWDEMSNDYVVPAAHKVKVVELP